MVRVAVLAGGPSNEHEVSLATSANLLIGLRAGGHDARPVLITRDERWCVGRADDELSDAQAAAAAGEHLPASEALARLADDDTTAYIGLHGAFGEDGQVQRLLEAAGIAYTGSGPVASAMGMDKELMKLAATKLGAACARHEVVEPGPEIPIGRVLAVTGLPCFVKPVNGGSSVGVTRVTERADLAGAVRRARQEDGHGRVLVEEAIDGMEVTCGVLRVEGVPHCLPLVAIDPKGHEFYDYRAKYASEQTAYICPAVVSEQAAESMREVSRALFVALGLRGVARVDFIVERETGRACFLEVNTLPGFTEHSLVPLAARTDGMALPVLLDHVLRDNSAVPVGRP